MNDTMKSVFKWVASIWSEPDGGGSSTRVHITLLLAFVITVGLSFGALVHLGKVSLEQFNSFLGAAGGFVITTCGPLYALNKGSDAYKNKQNGGQ